MKPVKQAELQNTLLSVLGAGGAAPRTVRTAGPADAPADQGRSLRILVVEDGLTNRKLAVGLLSVGPRGVRRRRRTAGVGVPGP